MGSVVSPPLAHHAAILLWTAREQDRLYMPSNFENIVHQGPAGINVGQPGIVPIPTADLLAVALRFGARPSISTLSGLDVPDFPEGMTSYTPDYMRTCYATVNGSSLWDGEWQRMAGCRNAIDTSVLACARYRWTPGTLSGLWDGIFLVRMLVSWINKRLILFLKLPVLDDWIRVRDTLSFIENPNDTDNQPRGMVQPTENTLNVLEESAINNVKSQQSWSVEEYTFNQELSPPGAKPVSSVNTDPLHGHLPKDFNIVKIQECKWGGARRRWIHGISVKEAPDSVPAFYE